MRVVPDLVAVVVGPQSRVGICVAGKVGEVLPVHLDREVSWRWQAINGCQLFAFTCTRHITSLHTHTIVLNHKVKFINWPRCYFNNFTQVIAKYIIHTAFFCTAMSLCSVLTYFLISSFCPNNILLKCEVLGGNDILRVKQAYTLNLSSYCYRKG